jgi:hypothetical protein
MQIEFSEVNYSLYNVKELAITRGERFAGIQTAENTH